MTLCTADSMDRTANKNIVSGFKVVQNSDVINALLLIDCINTFILNGWSTRWLAGCICQALKKKPIGVVGQNFVIGNIGLVVKCPVVFWTMLIFPNIFYINNEVLCLSFLSETRKNLNLF